MGERAHDHLLRVVYHGAALSGKTTNLQYVYAKTRPEARDPEITSLSSGRGYHLLSFCFYPLSVPPVRGHRVRVQLALTSGPAFENPLAPVLLRRADAIIVVIDQAPGERQRELNLRSLAQVRERLASAARDIPIAIQYNKADLASRPRGRSALYNPFGAPEFDAVAWRGDGVFETLKSAVAPCVLGLRAGAMVGELARPGYRARELVDP